MVWYGMVEVSKGGKWVQPTLPLSPEREITEILCSPPMAPILPQLPLLAPVAFLAPPSQAQQPPVLSRQTPPILTYLKLYM